MEDALLFILDIPCDYKMKIAIIGSRGYPYTYSGYETFVRELSQRLMQRQIEVTVYCHKNLFKKRPARLNGINLIYLQTIEKKNLSQFIHSLQSILHACFRNYDVILVVNAANGSFGFLIKVFRKKNRHQRRWFGMAPAEMERFRGKVFFLGGKTGYQII